MLDQLRAMGVFACVVEQNSFSGAARNLGITTSAVSQQVRALEQDMDVTLLYRSTRKISLTEAGEVFYQSCKEMLAAAERGKVHINELRDDLMGDLCLATTPELASNHIIPALSHWLNVHKGLNVSIRAENQLIDLASNHIDIALRMCSEVEQSDHTIVPLAHVEQLLVAAPSYLNQTAPLDHPSDLAQHNLVRLMALNDSEQLQFTHAITQETVGIHMRTHVSTDNICVSKSLCQNGLGLGRILYLDIKKELLNGELVEVLPNWKLPKIVLYAVVPAKVDVNAPKIQRCLDVLKTYFEQLPGGRIYQ